MYIRCCICRKLKNKRKDVRIVSDYDNSKNAPVFSEDTIGQLMTNSPVYVTSPVKGYCPEFLFENCDFVKTGVLWRVVEQEKDTR